MCSNDLQTASDDDFDSSELRATRFYPVWPERISLAGIDGSKILRRAKPLTEET
jgi:hypothetical protein